MEVGDGAGVDLGVSAGSVHLLGGGAEDEGDTDLFKHVEIAVEVSGVGCEVLVGAELGGVDEDGGGYGVVIGGGAFDEGHVAAVEVAHGRDEAEGAVCRGPGGAEVGDGLQDLHGVGRLQARRTASTRRGRLGPWRSSVFRWGIGSVERRRGIGLRRRRWLCLWRHMFGRGGG